MNIWVDMLVGSAKKARSAVGGDAKSDWDHGDRSWKRRDPSDSPDAMSESHSDIEGAGNGLCEPSINGLLEDVLDLLAKSGTPGRTILAAKSCIAICRMPEAWPM